MKGLARNELTFHNVTFTPVNHSGQIWLTSAELAKALHYKKSDAVTQIYGRYQDEFTDGMSTTLKMSVVRKTGAVDIPVRVFSLRGAHLIAMFANTQVAKEFRRWVLDILDREVERGNVNPAFDFDMNARNAEVAHEYMYYIYRAWCEKLKPSLRAMGSPLAVELEERIKSSVAISHGVSRDLNRAAGRIH